MFFEQFLSDLPLTFVGKDLVTIKTVTPVVDNNENVEENIEENVETIETEEIVEKDFKLTFLSFNEKYELKPIVEGWDLGERYTCGIAKLENSLNAMITFRNMEGSILLKAKIMDPYHIQITFGENKGMNMYRLNR
jgi:hypothetical protein